MLHRFAPCCPNLLKQMPFWLLRLIGAFLGAWRYLTSSRECKIARYNIGTALPDLSKGKRERMLRQSLIQNAVTSLELLRIWFNKRQDSLPRIVGHKGLKLLECSKSYEKGVIVAVPYVGNWEMVANYLSSLGGRILISAVPPYPDMAELVLDGRSSAGAILVPNNDQEEQRYIDELKAGAIACVFTDYIPLEEPDAVFAPFFHHEACTPTMVSKIARGSGAVVIFAFAERVKCGEFRIHWALAPEAVYDVEPVIAAMAINWSVRRYINIAPDQYWWSYERFMVQRDGGESPYHGL